jgi:Transglycosylase-like domain
MVIVRQSLPYSIRRDSAAAVAPGTQPAMPDRRAFPRAACALQLGAILLAAVISASATTRAHAGTSQTLAPQTIRYWTAIGSCETGGGGPPKWDWGSRHRPGEGAAFEGGLGFSTATWQLWAGTLGLLDLYPHAYDAPPLVQIRVAEYGLTEQNGYWGCMKYVHIQPPS